MYACGTGGRVTNFVVERAALDDGLPVMFQDGERRVRVAFDPDQITEPEALLRVALSLDRPLDGLHVIRRDE